jgi:hypothetical protein
VEQKAAEADALGHGIAPGALLRLNDLKGRSAVLGRGEWAIACQITGDATISELAQRSGLSLGETTELTGRLIRAGLCAPAGQSGWLPLPLGGDGPAVPAPGTDAADASSPAVAGEGAIVSTGLPLLPRRVPGTALRDGPDAGAGHGVPPSGPPGTDEAFRAPDLRVLRQVLRGLRSLR